MTARKRTRDDEAAGAVLRALGHPLRRRIMRQLMEDEEPTSPTQAARLLNASLSNVSYHFRVLTKAQALEKTGERAVRGAIQHFYRVNPGVSRMPMVTEVLAATDDAD